MNIVSSVSAVFGEIVLIWTISYVQFAVHDLWIPFVTLSLTSVAAFVSTSIFMEATEQKEKKRIQKIFGQYVDEEVVRQIIEAPENAGIAGESREVTLLFSDLKGFTSLSESLKPRDLVRVMNTYFAQMSEIIRKNRGTIDKFIGDSIMAFWGAPIPNSDSPYLACLSALQMQSALAALREKWGGLGMKEIKQRIGINTGYCIIGNVGYERKTNYTALGDSVNLASRLEGMNKRYGTSILISEFTRAKISHRFVTREIERVNVDGKSRPVTIYELMAKAENPIGPNRKALLEYYNQALIAYKKQEWDEALAYLEYAMRFDSEDPVCKFLVERINLFRLQPPGPKWDGVFVLGSKRL